MIISFSYYMPGSADDFYYSTPGSAGSHPAHPAGRCLVGAVFSFSARPEGGSGPGPVPLPGRRIGENLHCAAPRTSLEYRLA